MTDTSSDIEVLEPLRAEEQELDALLTDARLEAERRIAAAREQAKAFAERARHALAEDIAALTAARARENVALNEGRLAEASARVAARGEAVRAHREAALGLILARVTGEPP